MPMTKRDAMEVVLLFFCSSFLITFASANHVVGAIGHDSGELEVDDGAGVP